MDKERAEALATAWRNRWDRPSTSDRPADARTGDAAVLEVGRALRWLVPDDATPVAVVGPRNRRPAVCAIAGSALLIVDGDADDERSGRATVVNVALDRAELQMSVVSDLQDDDDGNAWGDLIWTVKRGERTLLEVQTGFNTRKDLDEDHKLMVALAGELGWHLPIKPDSVRWRHG